MVFRFIGGNKYFGLDKWFKEKEWFPNESIFVGSMALEIYFVLMTLLYTYVIYKFTIIWFLSGFEERIKPGEEGEDLYIRKAEKLSVNDYSFFLLTLLLPLISLDHSSVINLAMSLMIISFVISIYVKTDAVSVCPLLFFSGRRVYKGVISTGEKDQEEINPSLRKEVVFIMKKDKITFTKKVRGESIVNEVYYLTNNNAEE
jgi:hypothetical protein